MLPNIVPIITVFYIALNKSNELAESISLQLQLTTSAIYLRAHGLGSGLSPSILLQFSAASDPISSILLNYNLQSHMSHFFDLMLQQIKEPFVTTIKLKLLIAI